MSSPFVTLVYLIKLTKLIARMKNVKCALIRSVPYMMLLTVLLSVSLLLSCERKSERTDVDGRAKRTVEKEFGSGASYERAVTVYGHYMRAEVFKVRVDSLDYVLVMGSQSVSVIRHKQ